MDMKKKFKNLNIDCSSLDFEQSDCKVTYFCTPKSANIIGWAGVDGIHYCTIRGFGEMIFAVSPENLPDDYVHPIARNFEDLLRLLIACGGMAAIEQAHAWDRNAFESFLEENRPTEKQSSVINELKTKLNISPVNDPFGYIKELQSEFDYSKIKYTSEYYDIDMNPYAEPEAVEWKVSYDGGFWRSKGRGGKEIPIEKAFEWNNEKWYIPAAYACSKGLVVDICMEADPEDIKAFIDKWDLFHEDEKEFTREEQQQIENEHPLNADFCPEITLNGKLLQNDHGYGTTWISESCLPDGMLVESEAKRVLEHYDMDLSRGWMIRRCSFLWATKRKPEIKSLELTLKRAMTDINGIRFHTPDIGESVSFIHPITGVEHTLTVHEYESKKMEQRHFHDENMEFPTHYKAMIYTLSPDISGMNFMLSDCAEGDRPRFKKTNPNEFAPVAVCSAAIGIIGGADGPTAILMSNGSDAKLHAACSSLHFEPAEEVEWKITFREKLVEDIKIGLI